MASNDTKPTVGFVGLGAMGLGMATQLVAQGYAVKGYDVFGPSVERFAQQGGIPAGSLRESAEGVAAYVCMVASAKQAQEALFGDGGVVEALPQNATLLLCSTVPSAYAQSVEAQLASRSRGDVFFVDCPVSGGAARAAAGTLTIMAGGSDAALQKADALLRALADPAGLYVVAGGVGQGSNMKMVHQVLAAIHILLASEVMGLAARLGLDARETFDAVVASEAWFWMFENRVPRMLGGAYRPGVSALTIILKDVGIITSMARHVNFPMPLSTTAEQIYLLALARDFGADDDAGMIRMYHGSPLTSATTTTTTAAANSNLSPQQKLTHVLALARGVQLCAAAEAISLARHLHLDLRQFHTLASSAAGGSKVFAHLGHDMIAAQEGERPPNPDVKAGFLTGLAEAVDAARAVECPVPLGAEALSLLTGVDRRHGCNGIVYDYFGLLY